VIQSGLCSITFRKLSPEGIISACEENGLKAIEWGGDIHCPHGNESVASRIRKSCEDAGISTPSYGSYYRMNPKCAEPDFRRTLDTAVALGASTIRVWAGARSSAAMDYNYRQELISEARRIASLAGEANCRIAFEYHRGTATDTNDEALRLLNEVNHPAAGIYWQPREATKVEDRVAGLRMILPRLQHLHVFNWIGQPAERRPLTEAHEEWVRYASLLLEANLHGVCAYLEFVADDSLDSLRQDAQALQRILAEAARSHSPQLSKKNEN
jgi:3-dehydroshikimate dehydratase